MGNHMRGPSETQSTSGSASECGAVADDSTQAQPLVADPPGGSGIDAPDDPVPGRPFPERPR
jgi:hypothetical protein